MLTEVTVARKLVLASLAALCVTACGTTVPMAQQQRGADTTGPGGAPAARQDQQQGPDGSRISTTSATAEGGGEGLPTSGTPAVPRPSSSSDALAPPVAATGSLGHGVTKDSIQVGVVILKNGDKFANGLGFSISFGNAQAEFSSVIADLNRRGGVLGRRIEPVIGYYDLGGAAVDPEGQQAALCATFTQDHHVFAVLMPYNALPSFRSCLAKAHTLFLNGSAESTDDAGQQQLAGSYIAPSLTSYSRYPRTLVAELQRHGFFGTSPARKAGILVLDTPDMVRPAEQSMARAIAATGTKVALIARVPTDGSSTSAISGAVLKFKTAGITHVFFVQAAGGLPLYFMQDAQSQQYFPKYALSSFEVPGFFLQGQAPDAQLANSYGIGWEPFFDLKAAQFPTRPQEKRCFDIISRGGEQNANRQSNLTATPVCDLVWLFEAAAREAGPALTTGSWLAGLRRVGGSYASPVALHSDFSSGRPDGATGYRWVSFVGECACFRYSGAQKNGWL
jgi:hypothetical protein